MVEESEGGRPTASPAVLLYRPEEQTVELRRPSHLDHTEIKKFSPVILRAVRVPKYDTRKGKPVWVLVSFLEQETTETATARFKQATISASLILVQVGQFEINFTRYASQNVTTLLTACCAIILNAKDRQIAIVFQLAL